MASVISLVALSIVCTLSVTTAADSSTLPDTDLVSLISCFILPIILLIPPARAPNSSFLWTLTVAVRSPLAALSVPPITFLMTLPISAAIIPPIIIAPMSAMIIIVIVMNLIPPACATITLLGTSAHTMKPSLPAFEYMKSCDLPSYFTYEYPDSFSDSSACV